MTPKWFVETFGQENIELLYQSIKDNGSELITSENCIFRDMNEILSKEECVIFFGSLEFGAEVKRKAKWIPGVYCDLPKFACSNYYPRLHSYLLNQNHLFLPYGELLLKKDFLFNTLGNSDCIFVRPNTGYKLFTGKVLYKETYEKDIDKMGFYDVQPEDMCVIAEPVNIYQEYRFFVVDKQVVTGSLYKENDETKYSKEVDSKYYDYASEVADVYQPEVCFVLDIAITTDGEIKLLELNSFSCSGLYECDTNKIVEAANKVAEAEWLEYQ